MSFLQSLLGGWTSTAKRRQALVDLMVMAGLADGALDQRDLDRIARALETREELRGLEWKEVILRATAVQSEAPSFPDAKKRVARSLSDRGARRFALSLVAQFLGSPLSTREDRFLHELARELNIDESDKKVLLAPWSEVDPLANGYVRCAFNDPDRLRREPFFDAMAHTETDVELALLTFKLVATRALMTRLSDSTQLHALGELIELVDHDFRVDAFLKAGDKSWLGRFLARGEALHATEHAIIPKLLEQTGPGVHIFVGYAETLPPPDATALAQMASSRLLVERLEI